MIAALIVIIAAAVPLPGRGGAGWPDAWVIIGIILAAAAVGGTIWNGWQIYRHVSLAKRDADGRLRPVLAWTADEDMPSHTFAVVEGTRIKIRIINAGQVAAMKIVLDARMGMTGDFEAGGESRHKGARWGALAPGKSIVLDLAFTEEELRSIRKGAELLHFQILLKYQDPVGNAYEYTMSGEYDGHNVFLFD